MKTIIGKQLAPILPSLHSAWTSYTNGNFVRALLVQADFVWAATSGGVVRWTRSTGEYVTYTTEHGLASNDVTGLCQSQDGTLWFATRDSGLCALSQERRWDYFSAPSPLDSNHIQALCLTGDDSLWVSTPSRVYQLDPKGEWHQYEFNSVMTIYQSRDGALWLGRFEDGVVRLDSDGTVTAFDHEDALGGITVYAIYQADDDAMWFGGYESGVRRLDQNGQWSPELDGDTDWYGVTSISQAADGALWFGRFDRLLFRRVDGTWDPIGLFDELDKYSALPSVKLHRVGDALWLGLWGDGILQIEPDGETTHYLTDDKLAANDIQVITQSADGSLWFGTARHGVNRLTEGGTWTTFTQRDGLVSDHILAICQSTDGALWFGTAAWPGRNKGGISRLDIEGGWRTFDEPASLTDCSVKTIAQRYDGSLWFGLGHKNEVGGGVYCLHPDGRWETVFDAPALQKGRSRSESDHVNVIFASADGSLWFAMQAGVRCLDRQNRWHEFATVDGQPIEAVIAITQHADGALWFASEHNHLWRLDAIGQWTPIARPENFDSELTTVFASADATLWIGTRYFFGEKFGLYRLDHNQTWTLLETADGLATCTVNTICESRDGTLWFGTTGGICRYHLAEELAINDETSPPTAYRIKEFSLELVMVDGSPVTTAILYQALQAEDAEVQVRAAFGLATLGDLSPTVIDTLLDAADWRRDPEASASARAGIVTLSKTNPALITLLLAALQQNKVALSGVAECLGEIGQATPAVIDGLVAFIQHSDDKYATVSAAYSLIQLGYERDALIERLFDLHRRGDMIVRAVALDAFTLLKEPPPQAIDLLLIALRQGKSNARSAVRGLARIGLDQPHVIDALVQASGASDWQTRDAAIGALAKIINPGPAVVDAICNALSDHDSFVRMQAIAGVGNLSKTNPTVIDKLLTMLAAEEQKAQRQPKVAADETTHTHFSPLQELENMIHLRGNIAIALAQLGWINDAVIAAFLAELGDEDASVRERIVRNWWLLGKSYPSVLDALQTALQDEAEIVRVSAAASWEKLDQRDLD